MHFLKYHLERIYCCSDEYTTPTFYPSQTKISEGLTKDAIRIFEALFKGVSTWFGSFVSPSKIFVWGSRQLFQPRIVVHFFGKIVKSRFVKKGDELPTAGLGSINFEYSDKSVNHKTMSKYLTKCSPHKGRFEKKGDEWHTLGPTFFRFSKIIV